MASWDPQQYLKFSDARLRPGFDLLSQVADLPPGPLYDLGCGTGVHARAIAARWPDRQVTGIDTSPQMLAQAARDASAVQWMQADIAGWSAPAPAALIFSNATLQWLGAHRQLFPHLLHQLAPGGVLAVQMPRNFAAPSHALMRATAAAGPWAAALQPLMTPAPSEMSMLGPEPVAAPEIYYDLLAPLAGGGVELWETEYLHRLEGEDAVLEWMRGTALRPVLAALTPALGRDFLDAFAAKLRAAYPRRADGATLLPFRRLFLIARA